MGLLGTVVLRWTVYQVNTTTGQRYTNSTSDIASDMNSVTFFEGNASMPIAITVVNDVEPELEEVFEVALEIEEVFGDSEDGARLGNFSVSRIVVAESDDPYGLFRFDSDSRIVELAEDVGVVDTTVQFGVERTFGTLGEVQVCVCACVHAHVCAVRVSSSNFCCNCRSLGRSSLVLVSHSLPSRTSSSLALETQECPQSSQGMERGP